MRIIIHIGSPKTGSSAIQFFLNENRGKLKRQRIFYPPHKVDRNKVSSGHSALSEAVRMGDSDAARKLLDGWIVAAEREGCETLVLSSEGLFAHPKEVSSLISGYHSIVVHILAYFRNPVDKLVSNHNQGVKRHDSTLSLEHFLRAQLSEDNRGVNGGALLDWQEMFGQGKLKVRPYYLASFRGGNLESDFLDWIGVRGLRARGFKVSRSRINSSYTGGALELKRLLNLVIASVGDKVRHQVDLALQHYSDQFRAGGTGQSSVIIAPSLYSALVEKFKPVLSELNEKLEMNCPEDFYLPQTVQVVDGSSKATSLGDVVDAYHALTAACPEAVSDFYEATEHKLLEGGLDHSLIKLAELLGIPLPSQATTSWFTDKQMSVLGAESSEAADYLRELGKLMAANGYNLEAQRVIASALRLRPNGREIARLYQVYSDAAKASACDTE